MRWPSWILPCLCACSADPTAAVRVVAAPARARAEITRMSVAVQPAGVSADLALGGATFSGTVRAPVGIQTVVATAWAGAAPVASEGATVTVAKGATVPVTIRLLDATGPAPLPDHSPVITSLGASATAVTIGEQVAVTAGAFDADGDPIAWSWSAAPAGCGTFATPHASSTTWTAAAVGRCALTVTATSRALTDGRMTAILVGAPAAPSPSLVQHVSSNTNEIDAGATDSGSSTPRNDFRFTLPNPVLSENVLILGLTMQRPAAEAISVTGIADSSGDTWSTIPVASVGTGTTGPVTAIFVLPKATAGTHTITISTSASPSTFQYTISEFSGVDGSSVAGSGSHGAQSAPNIDAGTFTPTDNDATGGNLIWAIFSQAGDPFQTSPTDWTPGDSFTLLDADLSMATSFMQSHASMWWTQATRASVTPGVTLTSGGSQEYQGVAVALRAANVGTPAPTTGIRINRILHTTHGAPPTTWRFKVPSSGNKLVLVVNEQDIIHITRVTDDKGNSYASYLPPSGGPQFWYTTGTATTGHDLVATVTSSGTPVNATALWYDISGADTVDGTAENDPVNNGASCTTTCPHAVYGDAPVITPPSIGLTIAACFFGTGPSPGFATGSPAGAIFDYVWYTGITDASRMDNSDCRAHFYNGDLATQHWNWAIDWQYYDAPVTGTTAGSSAIHIKALTAGP